MTNEQPPPYNVAILQQPVLGTNSTEPENVQYNVVPLTSPPIGWSPHLTATPHLTTSPHMTAAPIGNVTYYNFGTQSQPYVCPYCRFESLTKVKLEDTALTHLSAVILCFLGCWCCVPLPYFMTECKSVDHYCPNCHQYLGTYNRN